MTTHFVYPESKFVYPECKSQAVKLIQFTDPHLFADQQGELLGVNTAESLQVVLDDILQRQFKMSCVLVTGDLTQDHSPESYQRFVEITKQLDKNCHILPGNHDEAQLFASYAQGEHLSAQKQILLGNWLILMLDSTLADQPSGALSLDEFAWITQAMQAHPEQHVLLVMHHHPIKSGCEWLDQHMMHNGHQLLEFVAQYPQIKGLLWGHVHQEMDQLLHFSELHQVRLLGTPSTCVQFKPNQVEFAVDQLQPGYRKLELAPDGQIFSRVFRVDDEFAPDTDAWGYD